MCSNHFGNNDVDGWKYFLRVETNDDIIPIIMMDGNIFFV